MIKKRWKKISILSNVPVEISGLDAMPKFEIKHKKNDFYKMYIVAEMLKHNILAKNIIYLSTSHSKKQIDYYMQVLQNIFYKIGEDISNKKNNVISSKFYKSKKEISLKRLN